MLSDGLLLAPFFGHLIPGPGAGVHRGSLTLRRLPSLRRVDREEGAHLPSLRRVDLSSWYRVPLSPATKVASLAVAEAPRSRASCRRELAGTGEARYKITLIILRERDGEKEDLDYTSRESPLVVVIIVAVIVSLLLLRTSILPQPLPC